MDRKRMLCEKVINDSSVTRVNISNIKYEWTVENFPLWVKDNTQPLESPIFPNSATVSKNCSTWRLILDPQPNGIHKDYIGLNIVHCSKLDGSNAIEAQVELSILNDKQEKSSSRSFTQIFDETKSSAHQMTFLRKGLLMLNRELVKTVLTTERDSLTIVCELRVREVNTHSCLEPLQTKCTLEPAWRTRVLDGLGQLMSSQSFADVMVKAQGQVIPAHRAVLAAASPIFAAIMLEQAGSKQPAFINLAEDIKHDVAVELVRSMYNGTVEGLHKRESMAFELLAAAGKYQVEGLKLLCQQWLFERVTVSSAVDLLIAADAHKTSPLRETLVKYIALNYVRIVDTIKFKELPARIAAEIYVQIGRVS